MKNRKLILIVALILALTVSLGSTLAYLTDTDSDVNVMVLGNVDIEQHEMKRVDGIAYNATLKEGDLVPFTDGIKLYPAYPVNGAVTDYTAAPEGDLLMWGPYVHTGTAGNGLWNDAKLVGAVDKMVFVENTGDSPAYFRTLIAYECPEGVMIGEPSQGAHIMINENGSKTVYNAIDDRYVGYITVDGVRYKVYEYIYQDALLPGEWSHPSLLQVVMTHNADNETVKLLGETYEIMVLSQAVQVTNLEQLGAEKALDVAFGDVTVAKAEEWFSGVENNNPFADVTTLGANDTLTNFDGDATVLDKNLTIDTTGSNSFGLDVGKIPLNVAYQFEPTMSPDEGDKSEYADWHADFVVSVDQDIPAYSIGLAGYYDLWCSLINNDKWVMLTSPDPISAGTEIRLVQAMGGGSITVSYRELCQYGNDGIGFLCGAVDLSNEVEKINGNATAAVPAGTVLTVELRLYEATGGGANTETGEYITTGTYTYTFD